MFKLQLMIKRIFDITVAVALIVILSPLLLIISLLIKIDSRGPIFFTQVRVGKDKKLFKVYKFRTMVENTEKIEQRYYTEENDSRITRVGKILRKTSLDELPQLLNVVKGEMSIVGPRPTLKYQVDQYNKFQMGRLKVLPGITGWAQVNGRNSIPWEERIKYDVYYVENFSLLFDLKILFKTVFVVLKGKGIYGSKENFQLNSDLDSKPHSNLNSNSN